MVTQDQVLLRQLIEVAANSLRADGEMLYQLFSTDITLLFNQFDKEGANKRGNSSRLTQSFHFFMFEPIFSPVNALNQPI